MGDDDSLATKASFTLTAAKLDLSDPLNATLEGVYLYVGEQGGARHLALLNRFGVQMYYIGIGANCAQCHTI